MAYSPLVPRRVYGLVFITLLLLTLVSVDVAFYDLGWLNLFVALALATTKATLVVLYFMHLRYSSRLIWGFVGAALFWFLLLVGLTGADIFTRDWVPEPPGWGGVSGLPEGRGTPGARVDSSHSPGVDFPGIVRARTQSGRWELW